MKLVMAMPKGQQVKLHELIKDIEINGITAIYPINGWYAGSKLNKV